MRRTALLVLLSACVAALAPALAADRETGATPPKSTVPGAATFVNLRPIVLPVIEGNAVTRQVGILLTLELGDDFSAESIEPKRRQLMDAFITELHRIYGWRSGQTRVVNETLIKTRLLKTADGVLGPGVVRAVLIRQLVEQER